MKLILTILAVLFMLTTTQAQEINFDSTNKKVLDHSLYDSWKRLEKAKISQDGEIISFEVNPAKGNGYLYFYDYEGRRVDSILRGYDAGISANSLFAAYKVKPSFDTIRSFKKKKPEDLLKDTLGITLFKNPRGLNVENFWDSVWAKAEIASLGSQRQGQEEGIFSTWKVGKVNGRFTIWIPKLKSFQVAENNTDWVAFLSEGNEPPKNFKKLPSIREGYDFTIFSPTEAEVLRFGNVTEFAFSKYGNFIIFAKLSASAEAVAKKMKADDKKLEAPFVTSVYLYDVEHRTAFKIFSRLGSVKKLTFDESGRRSAFIFSSDTGVVKRWEVFGFDFTSAVRGQVPSADFEETGESVNEIFPKVDFGYSTVKIADTSSAGILKGWEVKESGTLAFSQDGSKLFFGTAPKAFVQGKDTIPEDEKSRLDVWNWNDNLLQTQQLHDLEVEKKRTFTAVYRFEDESIYQLGDTAVRTISFGERGNSELAVGFSGLPYEKMLTYVTPEFYDIYSVDLKTGFKKLLLSRQQYFMGISSGGKFGVYFSTEDSLYYCVNLRSGESIPLTMGLGSKFTDEENDHPRFGDPYGIMGWGKNDEFVYIYDRYDVWKISPSYLPSGNGALRLTRGRESNTVFRYVKINPEETYLPDTLLLKAINQGDFSESFVRLEVLELKQVSLVTENAAFLQPIKGKRCDRLIWQRMTYREYPDLYVSDINFGNVRKLSSVNPQQLGYNWGNVQMVRWILPDSSVQRGLLYTPENLDVNKKYPMIVYFYEKYTQQINNHYSFTPSRSVINFPLYNSNGYVVFIPDIRYEVGHPGKSALNTILSGTESVCRAFSFVDRDNIGLQGQSWGGYEAAYVVTQTDFFKAAFAGAAVSNMTSAYGGIRWESGVARAFQYETDQSRIGKTLWDGLDLYIENSPLFFANRVKTPLLLMNNDNDGAVPWQQGIEFFVALRRLEKPCWMLCYNGDEHNLLKWANRVDLSRRMMEFFDVYLKGASVPSWMREGVPAVKKGG